MLGALSVTCRMLLGVTRGRLNVLKLAGTKKYPKDECESNPRANAFVLQSNAFTSPT